MADTDSLATAGLHLREETIDDAELNAALSARHKPEWPWDPAVIRWRRKHPYGGYPNHRNFIIEAEGTPIGVADWIHANWDADPERFAMIEVGLARDEFTPGRYQALVAHFEADLKERGSRVVVFSPYEDDVHERELLEAAGYELDSVARAWELDLVAHRDRLLAETERARERMREQGIRLASVADLDGGDDLKRKIHEMVMAAEQDIPHTITIVPDPFETWLKEWSRPDVREDRYWVALDGERVAAISYLTYPPTVGLPYTGLTAAAREYRGRGIARAVKMETIAQAIAVGAPGIRTDNDEKNAPMLHINATLGYHSVPGWAEYHKRVG